MFKRSAQALGLLFIIPVYATAQTMTCEDALNVRLTNSHPGQVAPIDLKVRVGSEESLFYRGGANNLTSVEVRTVSGNRPLVGGFFPAGNSGAMMMLEGAVTPELHIGNGYFPVQAGADRGITVPVVASNLPVEQGRAVMNIESFALGSVRFLRDHVVADHGSWVEYGMKPAEINENSSITAEGDLLVHRVSLSGRARYTLRVHPLNGAVVQAVNGKYRVLGGTQEQVDFEVTTTTSEPPRVGLPASELVKPDFLSRMTDEERQKLEFLFYQDGAVAGAHAYMTYFGRDPLITAMIAQDAFTPRALEVILAAALDTIDAQGNIAHEPEMGERASLTRKQRGAKPDAQGFYDETIIYDYSMVDTQFLLMPVLDLLVKQVGAEQAKKFLSQKSRSVSGRSYVDLLTLNKNRILQQASAFARAEMGRAGNIPDPANFKYLIRLLDGHSTGQWRDSDHGIADGRIPFETNAVLVPAALQAILNLHVLNLPGWSVNEVATTRAYLEQWKVKPYQYFRVELQANQAQALGDTYAQKIGLRSNNVDLFRGKPLIFYGVALRADGTPIPLMHSDVSFAMLYTDPPPEILEILMRPLRLPYPFGLDSPAGQFIATPAYVEEKVQAYFGLTAYHAGVWSMQQEMEARSLNRQAARQDLSPKLKHEVRETQFRVWRAIARNMDWRPVELWSGRVENGVMTRMPFGTGKNIVAESCLDQFWSNTKIANFAPEGWDKIPAAQMRTFMSWNGQAPVSCGH